MRSDSLHQVRTFALLLCTAFPATAALSAVSPSITPAPAVFARDIPYDGDPALYGYKWGDDFTFTPILCATSGETITTIDGRLHCCASTSSQCRITTSCTAGTAFVTVIPDGPSSKEVCSGMLMPQAGNCGYGFVYETFTSDLPNDATAQFSRVQCNYGAFLKPVYSTYFRDIPADTAVLSSVSQQEPYTPFVFSTLSSSSQISSSQRTSSAPRQTSSSTGTSDDVTSSQDSNQSTQTSSEVTNSNQSPLPNSSSTPASNPAAASGSSGGLSRSDGIALGVGIGIGLPTVIMTALAWWYPRRGKSSVQQPSSSPPMAPNNTAPANSIQPANEYIPPSEGYMVNGVAYAYR